MEIEQIKEKARTVEIDKKAQEFYNQGITEISEFYNYDQIEKIPPLILVEERKEFDKIAGGETENWVVGVTNAKLILLFTPDSYERESKNTHKYTDENYFQLIKHEISHTIVRDLAKNMCPRWLNEGLAIYSSKQILSKRKPESFNVFLKAYKSNKMVPGIYDESGFAVEMLIQKFSKDMMIDFLKTLKDINTEEKFKNHFENYFKINLTYEWFNDKGYIKEVM